MLPWIIGAFVAGVIFAQLALKLFGIGWTKLEKNISNLGK